MFAEHRQLWDESDFATNTNQKMISLQKNDLGVFCKKDVLKQLVKLTGKHQTWQWHERDVRRKWCQVFKIRTALMVPWKFYNSDHGLLNWDCLTRCTQQTKTNRPVQTDYLSHTLIFLSDSSRWLCILLIRRNGRFHLFI